MSPIGTLAPSLSAYTVPDQLVISSPDKTLQNPPRDRRSLPTVQGAIPKYWRYVFLVEY